MWTCKKVAIKKLGIKFKHQWTSLFNIPASPAYGAYIL